MMTLLLDRGRGSFHAVNSSDLDPHTYVDWYGKTVTVDWKDGNHPAGKKGWVLMGTCDDVDSDSCLMALSVNKTRALGFGGQKSSFPASYKPPEK